MGKRGRGRRRGKRNLEDKRRKESEKAARKENGEGKRRDGKDEKELGGKDRREEKGAWGRQRENLIDPRPSTGIRVGTPSRERPDGKNQRYIHDKSEVLSCYHHHHHHQFLPWNNPFRRVFAFMKTLCFCSFHRQQPIKTSLLLLCST